MHWSYCSLALSQGYVVSCHAGPHYCSSGSHYLYRKTSQLCTKLTVMHNKLSILHGHLFSYIQRTPKYISWIWGQHMGHLLWCQACMGTTGAIATLHAMKCLTHLPLVPHICISELGHHYTPCTTKLLGGIFISLRPSVCPSCRACRVRSVTPIVLDGSFQY